MTDLSGLCSEFESQLTARRNSDANFAAAHRDDLKAIVAGVRERDEEIARLRKAFNHVLYERNCFRDGSARLHEACETLLEYVPSKCDDNKTPAWCCNHQKKRCEGEADVSKVRELLNATEKRP